MAVRRPTHRYSERAYTDSEKGCFYDISHPFELAHESWNKQSAKRAAKKHAANQPDREEGSAVYRFFHVTKENGRYVVVGD
jgi:hypothetical protein